MEIGLLLSIVAVSLLLLFIAFKLNEDHKYLRIVALAFFFLMLILIPKATLDYTDNCAVVVSNATDLGMTISYNYDYYCAENEFTTALIFYRLMLAFIGIISLYFLIYLIVNGLKTLKEGIKK